MKKSNKSIVGLIASAITGSKSSQGSNSRRYVPTTTTTILDGPGLGEISKTAEKIKTVLSDVETEGKKRGYERAAAEYDAAYERIENEYLAAKRILEQQTAGKEAEVSRLLTKLQQLESKKKTLEHAVREKAEQVSETYHISPSSVSQCLSSGTLLTGGTEATVLDLIYRYKGQKLKNAEEKGYAEARQLHRKKIKELKDNLERLRAKGEAEIRDLANLIADAIEEISESETKIAELEIVLNS